MTLPTSGVQYAWNGDFGFQCGALWGYGNTTFSADPSGGVYQPRCNWIDGNDSNGLHTQAIGMHLPSVLANQARVDQYNNDNDLMCKADPRFKLYDKLDVEDPIPYFKSETFDLGTLVDFNRDETLDKNNWATTPVDRSALKGIGSERRDTACSYDQGQTSSQNSNSTSGHAILTNTTICGSGSSGNKGEQDPAGASNNNGNIKPAGNNNRTVGNSTFSGTRTAPPQNEKHRGQLIKSGAYYHSAKELCDSATSYGPDFVSIIEGLYCDMGQKKTWPLCQTATQNTCFDNTANKMRLGAGNNRRDSKGVVLPRKVYNNVEQW